MKDRMTVDEFVEDHCSGDIQKAQKILSEYDSSYGYGVITHSPVDGKEFGMIEPNLTFFEDYLEWHGYFGHQGAEVTEGTFHFNRDSWKEVIILFY